MGIFTIISALLPFAVSELQSFKIISPSTGALIEGVEGAASAFTSELTSNPDKLTVTAATLLAGISAAVQVLSVQTDISPKTLAVINALDKAISAGLAASAITVVDPTALQPITPA